MIRLLEHHISDLIGMGTRPTPGTLVRHARDNGTFGIIVGRMGDRTKVLWTCPPYTVWFEPEDFKIRKGFVSSYSVGIPRSYHHSTTKLKAE